MIWVLSFILILTSVGKKIKARLYTVHWAQPGSFFWLSFFFKPFPLLCFICCFFHLVLETSGKLICRQSNWILIFRKTGGEEEKTIVGLLVKSWQFYHGLFKADFPDMVERVKNLWTTYRYYILWNLTG